MSKYVHINYRIVDKHMNRVFIIHTNEKFLSKFCLFIFLTLVYKMKKKRSSVDKSSSSFISECHSDMCPNKH